MREVFRYVAFVELSTYSYTFHCFDSPATIQSNTSMFVDFLDIDMFNREFGVELDSCCFEGLMASAKLRVAKAAECSNGVNSCLARNRGRRSSAGKMFPNSDLGTWRLHHTTMSPT